jgi:hypothetical protein
MADPRQDQAEQSARQRKAQERAVREKWERLEQSLEELQKVRAEAEATNPAECRGSESEPEARKMKQAVGGGFAPSYNVQLMTDAAQDIIVGVQVVQARNDQGQLEAGVTEVDQGKIRAAPVSGARPGQSHLRSHLGLPDLQHSAAVGPPALATPTGGGGGLNRWHHKEGDGNAKNHPPTGSTEG